MSLDFPKEMMYSNEQQESAEEEGLGEGLYESPKVREDLVDYNSRCMRMGCGLGGSLNPVVVIRHLCRLLRASQVAQW